MSRITTIEQITSPDILYPYYQDGRFEGIPEGLTSKGFYELISSAMTFMRFYGAYHNGELVGVFECRPKWDGKMKEECHVTWFTDSKVKRTSALYKMIEKKDNLFTFVDPSDADGHHAMARKGYIDYVGEMTGMHLFESKGVH